MNGARLWRSGAWHTNALLAASCLFLTSACGGQTPDGGTHPKPVRPTPAPQFKERIERVSRDVILRYAQSLIYDTVAAVGDQQRLMLGKCPDSCRYGPLVDIQPEVGAAFLEPRSLGSGRIIGRFINASATPYEKLAIPASQVSWIWVDSTEGKWRAWVIPQDSKLPITSRAIDFERHEKKRWSQSLARWKWREDDEQAWFTCTELGCCKINQ